MKKLKIFEGRFDSKEVSSFLATDFFNMIREDYIGEISEIDGDFIEFSDYSLSSDNTEVRGTLTLIAVVSVNREFFLLSREKYLDVDNCSMFLLGFHREGTDEFLKDFIYQITEQKNDNQSVLGAFEEAINEAINAGFIRSVRRN